MVLKTNELRVRGFDFSSLVHASLALVISALTTAQKRTKRGLVEVSHLENSEVR